MESENTSHRAHCLIVTYPLQGHINPLLQFAKRLRFKGVKVTVITTKFLFKTTLQKLPSFINIDTISDGYDEGGREAAASSEDYLLKFKEMGSKDLTEIVKKFQKTDTPVNCIGYDPFLNWVLEVAKGLGLVGAACFTQSCAVDNIYYHVYEGKLRIPISGDEFLIPGLPPLRVCDLPSFVSDPGIPSSYIDLVLNQFENLGKADWVLCNSFHKLEEEVEDWMAKVIPLRTIGPTVPSMYLDKRLKDDKDYGLSMFKPNTIDPMMWLDKKPHKSVVYVSFGSLVQLEPSQMEELAMALKSSNFYFLWVVRSTEQNKLPINFFEETSEKVLIVPWCSQLEILSHDSIGCFVSHCGWNSTLEALSLGVPMVCVPHWSDQSTNAKYIADVWGVGVRLERGDRDDAAMGESL